MSNWYVLDVAGNPVLEPDLLKAARWYETAERHVADDEINGCRISTVFLGLDHQHGDSGPPILWETMVFWPADSGNECHSERYSTRAAALAGHDQACALVRDGKLPPKGE